jgi:PAS domain S-box-containing protein
MITKLLALIQSDFGILIFDKAKRIVHSSGFNFDAQEQFESLKFEEKEIPKEVIIKNEKYKSVSNHFLEYLIIIVYRVSSLVNEDLSKESAEVEYKKILDSIHDEVFVTDSEGKVLYVNTSTNRLYKKRPDELIGKNVREIEKELVFAPSVTERVLETKTEHSIIQTTGDGKKLLATGIPIFDDYGAIKKVVTNTRDLTELFNLKEEIELKNQLIEKFSNRINELQTVVKRSGDMVYVSPEMERIIHLIDKVADSDINILLTGESGVGKSMIAEIIHKKSNRKKQAFEVINCSAIPEALMESELFGYEGGAFTGSNKNGKRGLLEIAHKGTVFLDEVGELTINLQIKLLNVLQDRYFRRIGGIEKIKTNFRLITATNQNLLEAIESKKFRKDFFYRIDGIDINIPSLRERSEDIDILSNHFLNIYNNKYETNKKLSAEAMDIFNGYDWPGNIRELAHVIERVCLVSENDIVHRNDLPNSLLKNEQLGYLNFAKRENQLTLKESLEILEAEIIRDTYKKCNDSYQLAKALGISQPTASRKIQKYLKKRDEFDS